HAGAFALFAVGSCAILLPRLLPIRPGRLLAGLPQDGSVLVWSLGWWAHAVPRGQLLPYSHAVFAPGGTNLAWTTSIPLPGVLLSPVTWLFGPVAAFNVFAVAALATSAWAVYLLVDRLTGRWWPSVLAG